MKRLNLCVIMLCAISIANGKPQPFEKEAKELLSKMTLEEKVSQMVNTAPGIERLDILPYDWWNEALHGVARNGKATIFPQALALAATFDVDLIEDVAEAISDEARAKFNISQKAENYQRFMGLTFWSPNVNIFRDPRWGRGQETYGEDPFLTGQIGVAYVKGMQGDDPKYLKTAACAKHYAVHSGPEALRHHFDAYPSKKDLFETYLPAFEMLVKEADVESVMGAYNRVYGESASASRYFLTEILRDKWGFDGHVLSDCGAIKDMYVGHGIAKDAAEASAIALKSGLDLNCGDSYLGLVEAVERGLVSEKDIDESLMRLLITKFKLGLLGDDSDNPYKSISSDVICNEEHTSLARESAAKSIVLISNKDNTLPLKKDLKAVGVTGAYAADTFVLMGNYFGVNNKMSTILEGVVDAVDLSTRVGYTRGIMPVSPNKNPICWIEDEVVKTDACIVSIGLSSVDEGEEGAAVASTDIGDRLSMTIPAHHIKYLKDVKAIAQGKVIAVVTGCSGMDLSEVVECADAVILAWYPGQEGGNAISDIIFGDVSPSGRMPITFPMSVDQIPAFEDYSMKGRTYKYMTEKPQYPFGFGLSYTTFDYSNLAVAFDKKAFESVDVSLDVANVGEYDSDEVIQAYISTPNSGVTAPITSLVGFARLPIKSGESGSVEIKIDRESLMEVDDDGQRRLVAGEYLLRVGNASPSERSAELGGKWLERKFTIDAKGRVEM